MSASVKEVVLSAAAIEASKAVIVFGQELAKADAAFEMAIPQCATNVARVLGLTPTFEVWNEVAKAFQDAYIAQKKCEPKTAMNRWFAVTSYMEGNMEMKKPKAPTVAADKKAKERAALEKQVKAAKAQYVKPADAMIAAEKLRAEGKLNEAKIVSAAAVELSKQMQEDAKKQNKERVAKVKEQVKKEIAKLDDPTVLQAILDLIKNGSDAKPVAAKKPAKAKA